MKVSLYPPSWHLAIECARHRDGHGKTLEDFKRRLIGTAGEVAASIFLTGCDTAYRETYRQRLADDRGHENPDVLGFPNLEVKTVPHHLKRPHFAIAAAGQREPKVCDYLVLRSLDDSLVSFDVLGWMPEGLVEKTFTARGGWFPSGSPMLPVDCLLPASTCPWRISA